MPENNVFVLFIRPFKPSKKYFRGSAKFLGQNLRQIGPGVRELGSDIHPNKHRLLLYIYKDWKKYIFKHLKCIFKLKKVEKTI